MKGLTTTQAFAFLALTVCFSVSASGENFFPLPHDLNKRAPEAYQKQNIDEVISTSSDEELVKLSGQIIKKLKCSTYLFRDKTGEMHVQIDNEDIPAKGLLFSSPTIIKGEVSRDSDAPAALDADKIMYMF